MPNNDHYSFQQQQHQHTGHHQPNGAVESFKNRFIIVTILLIPLLVLTQTGMDLLSIPEFSFRTYVQFLLATAVFYFSLIFFQHAWHEIKARKFGMMTLVSVAVLAGYLFSAASTFISVLQTDFYIEITTLIWILLFGHYLEARSSQAAGNALEEVAKLLPSSGHLIEDGEITEVAVSELKKGDLILIRPGEKIAADGVIEKGEANIDQSLITGESKLVYKSQSDEVVAGSINTDGSLTIKITKTGKESTVGQIKDLIKKAQASQPQAQRLADKAAGVLTFISLGTALITIIIWSFIVGRPLVFGLTLAITVLVISCPHALGLAIPTVTTIAVLRALKNGLFIKDLIKLEQVLHIDYVVMDKTGTLTKGDFAVSDIVGFNNLKEKKVLALVASLEQNSSHVLAKAVASEAKKRKIKLKPVSVFKNIAGKGISGNIEGQKYYFANQQLLKEFDLSIKGLEKKQPQLFKADKTLSFLFTKNQLIGAAAFKDELKPESKKAINDLHQLGIKMAMLTGDNQKTAKTVADSLNIDTVFANVLPAEKYQHIQNLQEKGKKVMMVGDGVNDAPALTQADVGVAIGAGTDVAVEAGDIVLTRNNPQDIVSLFVLSRKVGKKMKQNLWWALGYNIIAIPAAAGVFAPFNFFLRPEIGAILMSLSTIIVVINALGLKKADLSLAAGA
jgi:P-type Cu2+ transporter